MRTLVAVCAASLALMPCAALAQRTEDVALNARGRATASGTIKGRGYADYRVKVRAGQSLAVGLSSARGSTYFNLLPPGTVVAMYNGSERGPALAARTVPIAGTYVVRVYQMGAAKDSGKVSQYALTFRVTGAPLRPLRGSDARIKGTPFHARGPVECSITSEPGRRQCQAYVIRYGGGSATVELRAGRTLRRVLFVKGKPAASDSKEAFTYERRNDETTVRFGDDPSEEYRIIDAFVLGG